MNFLKFFILYLYSFLSIRTKSGFLNFDQKKISSMLSWELALGNTVFDINIKN